MDQTDLGLCDHSGAHFHKEYFEHHDRRNAENDRSDNIKQQMHDRRGLRILLRTDTGHDRGHTSTDVLPHDDVDSRIKRNQSRCRKTLQDSDRRR